MSYDNCYNLSQIFEKVVKKNPNKIALRFANVKCTFKDIYNYSNNYINFLNKKKIKNKIIAIYSDKSPSNYYLMIACIRLGLPYTNLDNTIPFARNLKIIKKLENPIVFISQRNKNYKDLLKKKIQTFGFIKDIKKNLKNKIDFDGDTTCYIMFTSGSTGEPKGAAISHLNLINFIYWIKKKYNLSKNDNFVNSNPLYFDNSVFDFYGSIFNGCCLTPLNNYQVRDYSKILEYIDKKKCTIWFAIPSMFIFLLKMKVFKKNSLKNLKILSFGGEGFPKKDLKQIFDLYEKRIKFINVYGPTECTCICTSYDVKKSDFRKMNELLPLGKINENFSYSISNNELVLKGPNVGKGYYNNPKETSEKFFFESGITYLNKRCYKTGDIVMIKNGILYFKGRLDNQIKRMGYRIELEDIENNINSIKNVSKSVAIHIKQSGKNKIILFVEMKNKSKIPIQKEINKLLPKYMHPDEVFFISKIPMNQNGKINRRALNLKPYT